MTARTEKPKTVEEYFAGLDGPALELAQQLRELAREVVPEASEQLKWGNVAWVHPQGMILFVVSTHAKHANAAFTPSTREAFDAQLEDFETGKGTVKLPYGRPAPVDLLREMMRHRLREYEVDGVTWR
ncbi:DUF1801 domain-containing protein [Brachybacterium halotolerans subsp. kimchii]|uniref:iron chaperone n=1 Tax=Brachybacterium halotolerans TaxID=2795215 RepID=UPI001E351102|nr:DUF1801 domain-containing protein [Brachybacterium halotolerans]UEJ83074.1 DUF1801 domain-containing protein [Brachybacterium halotolerans subsp. kimchii]